MALLAATLLAGAAGGCATSAPEVEAPNVVQKVTFDLASAQAEISAYRRAHGLAAVTVDPALVAMAQSQATAMALADHLSHYLDGSLVARLAAAGLPPAQAVENVSAGYATMDDALAGWRRSAGHNANLLDPHMHRMGVAAAQAPATRYKRFWALVMTE